MSDRATKQVEFVQIAATTLDTPEWSGTILYGLDTAGRIWKRIGERGAWELEPSPDEVTP